MFFIFAYLHFNKCKPDLRPDISCFSYFLHSFDYCNFMTVMIKSWLWHFKKLTRVIKLILHY